MADGNHPDLGEGLARELEGIKCRIEDIALGLCLDSAVFQRHAASLQGFDEISQIVGEVARVLRERNSPQDVVKTLRLEAMVKRLDGARW